MCWSRAWLYWRSICSSVWSFFTRSSRRAISVFSLVISELAAGARKPWVGDAAGTVGFGVKASARARGQTFSGGAFVGRAAAAGGVAGGTALRGRGGGIGCGGGGGGAKQVFGGVGPPVWF